MVGEGWRERGREVRQRRERVRGQEGGGKGREKEKDKWRAGGAQNDLHTTTGRIEREKKVKRRERETE